MSNSKKVETVLSSPPVHWVGDGFPVRSVISPRAVQSRLSPYVLMDYAGPAEFTPTNQPRGVDSHPHRGFETVTVVYQGELEHRDSAGNSGTIGPGDVQWMTAGSGVLHEEKHSSTFSRDGGTLEMAQLWVNLPAKFKMTTPSYQTILSSAIPMLDIAKGAGRVRVIAGTFGETNGAAKTMTPVILWDANLARKANVRLPIHDGYSAAVFVRSGSVWVGDTHSAGARQLALLEQNGAGAIVEAEEDSEFIVIGGRPIDEPVVAYGPFVMNTQDEVTAAIDDVRAGRFGQLV